MANPYHVRLALSQYGEQFRAELFTEDLGDTDGDLLKELPPSLGEWAPFLAQGAELPPDAARQLGKDLFAALLGQPETGKKWVEVLAQAEKQKRPVRLLIDATSEAVRDLPYGLLCEPHDDYFLFRHGAARSVGLVRILRRCSPRTLKLRERLRVLIAVAEPKSADVPAFDAPARLKLLWSALHDKMDLFVCGPNGAIPLTSDEVAPYCGTTRESLRKALAGEFDAIHLLAHGHGAGVLLCDAAGAPAETTAGELGEWCGAGKASFAFLQVCKAGQTANRGGFGGVAQQLLNPKSGNLAAVIASTFPLDAEHSTDAAIGFYKNLAAGRPLEEALVSDLPENEWCWAFLELWARPGALGGTGQRSAFQFVSPYRGLASFNEQDADLFFGRRTELAEILQILRSDAALAVVGDSGSGKSSLLQAGLIHAVRQQGVAGLDHWKIVSLRPGYRPAQALLTALIPGAHEEPTVAKLTAALRGFDQPLLVVFDQFEEVFTLARDKAEVQMLTDALAETADAIRDRFRLVIGMRSEFLGQAASVRGLSRLIRRPWVLRPPGAGDMRDIVAGPAEHCGYTFQGPLADGDPRHTTGLLDRILADPLLARDRAGATAAPLPLLQFALERLWLKAVDKGLTEFTHAELDEVGGLAKAIAQHAESVFQSVATATGLGSAGRVVAEQLITGLVSANGTRQPRGRDELLEETGNAEAARAVADYLVGERLLTVRTDPEDLTKPMLDLSHEALILHWDRLRGWLAEDPQGRAMREEFRKATVVWSEGIAGRSPRSRRGLPGYEMANTFLVWVDNAKPKFGPAQTDFTAAMREMLTRRQRVRRSIMVSLAGLALASLILSIIAAIQTGRAKEAEGIAKSRTGEAQESARQARLSEAKAKLESAALALDTGVQLCENGRPRLGILAIAYSLQVCPSGVAEAGADEDAAAAARAAADLRRVILTNLAGWGSNLMCLMSVKQFPGQAIATDERGNYILMQNADRKIQLHDIGTGNPVGGAIQPLADPAQALSAKVLPDGRALIYNGSHARVWDLKRGQPLAAEFLHGTQGTATLSRDASRVATGSSNGSVELWDALTGKRIGKAMPHAGKIYSLEFTADGKFLATGCGRRPDALQDAPGVVHLYDVATCEPVMRKPIQSPATAVAVSSDGKVVGGGYELYYWKSRADKAPEQGANSESTAHLAYSPDNTSELLICNPSGCLTITHLNDGHREWGGERLTAQGWVVGAGFRSKDTVFTANVDGTVRLWHRPKRLEPEKIYTPARSGDGVLSVDFSPDGKAVALGTNDGFVYYFPSWTDPSKSTEFACSQEVPVKVRSQVVDLKFSADCRRLIAQGIHLRNFVFEPGHAKSPKATNYDFLAMADDGKTALQEHALQFTYFLQNLETGAMVGKPFTIPNLFWPPINILDQDDEDLLRVKVAAISRDQSRVAVVDREGRVQLADPKEGKLIGKPLAHVVDGAPDAIRSVFICAKSKHVLTRSYRACAVWSAETGELIELRSNRVGIQVSRFSPGGDIVLAGVNYNSGQAWRSAGKLNLPGSFLHSSQVWGIASNKSESTIVTASYDRTARLWDVATGKQIGPPMYHKQGVSDAVFNPEGTKVLTGSWDGKACLWAVPAPLIDEEKRISAWVEVMTGLRITSSAVGDLLSAKEWHDRDAELEKLGGPPLAFGK